MVEIVLFLLDLSFVSVGSSIIAVCSGWVSDFCIGVVGALLWLYNGFSLLLKRKKKKMKKQQIGHKEAITHL